MFGRFLYTILELKIKKLTRLINIIISGLLDMRLGEVVSVFLPRTALGIFTVKAMFTVHPAKKFGVYPRKKCT